jgi:hypothetical protein
MGGIALPVRRMLVKRLYTSARKYRTALRHSFHKLCSQLQNSTRKWQAPLVPTTTFISFTAYSSHSTDPAATFHSTNDSHSPHTRLQLLRQNCCALASSSRNCRFELTINTLLHAPRSIRSKRVQKRASNTHSRRTQTQRFEHVIPVAQTAVEENFHLR